MAGCLIVSGLVFWLEMSGRAGGQIDGWLGGLVDGSMEGLFKHEYYTDTRPVCQ